MKKVSLIVPIYNAEKFLENTLKNVLSQTYPNIELVAVDDGSTDSCLKILIQYEQAFLKKGYEYIIVAHEENRGLCAAINSGLKRVSGNYLCFPDADDELLPDYVAAMVETLEKNPSKDWTRCDYTIVLEEENRSYDVHLPRQSVYKNDFYDFISKFIPHNAWNMMVRREYFEKCIGKQIIDSRLTQEWSLLLPLSFYSDYARTCTIVYRYHIRKNAMSSWQKDDIISVIDHFDKLHELNCTILNWMQIPETEMLLCEKILNMYYTFAKMKAYRNRGCTEQMEKEYAILQTFVPEALLLTNDPEFAVRLSMDEFLGMAEEGPCMLFDKYKRLFMDGYEIYIDNQGGRRLFYTMCKAFGSPCSVVQIGEESIIRHNRLPKACLIENSTTYNNIIKDCKEKDAIFIDYRCLRDALRGWGYFKRRNNEWKANGNIF